MVYTPAIGLSLIAAISVEGRRQFPPFSALYV